MSDGPQTLADWIKYLHAAASVSKGSADYAEARGAVAHALQQIQHINAEANASPPTPVSTRDAVVRNAAQGVTSGFADELAGTMLAMGEPGHPMFDAAARHRWIDTLRAQRAQAVVERPGASIAGNVAGTMLNPLNKLLGPLTVGVGPATTGAIYGGVLGGAQGAGEGTGGPVNRALPAGTGAVLGTLLGAVGGKIGGKGTKNAQQVMRNLRGIFGSEAAQVAPVAETALPGGISETAARASLAKQGFTPANIEQALAAARGTAPAPQGLLSEIPGSGGQGFEVTGSRATPPAPTAPTVAEMTRPNVGPRQPGLLSSLGRGEQFPYYTRGGAAEQAIAPFPTPSAPPSSSLIPMQQLQMLLRLSPEEFEAAGGLFPKGVMDQLRQLRLANPGLLAATP